MKSFLIWSIIGLLYLLRNTHPLFKGIWHIIRLFFIILLTTLAANYTKDKVKEWWEK